MATSDAAEIKSVALDLIKRTYEQSEYITDGTQTYAFQQRTKMILANSNGLYLENEVGVCGALVQAVVAKDGESQYGGDAETGFDAEKLEKMPKEAIDEALSKIGAKEIPSGKYDIIFDGKQMRALLSAFSSVFSGRNAYLGLSLLKGKEGEKIASDCLTLIDDPMYSTSPMQTAFDGEGVAAYKKSVIENGVLKTLLYDLASADKVGKESTGNGVRSSYASAVSIAPYHFYIEGGEMTDEELLLSLGNGIYITELKGLHAGANAVTGDFSIESAGFEVKDGKICSAIKSFTVAGNFFELIKSIEALSSNVKFGFPAGFTVFGAPNTLIRGCSVAGT
jgi:PmbA protein